MHNAVKTTLEFEGRVSPAEWDGFRPCPVLFARVPHSTARVLQGAECICSCTVRQRSVYRLVSGIYTQNTACVSRHRVARARRQALYPSAAMPLSRSERHDRSRKRQPSPCAALKCCHRVCAGLGDEQQPLPLDESAEPCRGLMSRQSCKRADILRADGSCEQINADASLHV